MCLYQKLLLHFFSKDFVFCRPFGAGYLVSLTRGFTPGYVLAALRACCRAKRLFALYEKAVGVGDIIQCIGISKQQ